MLKALAYPEEQATFVRLARYQTYPRISPKLLNRDLFPSFVISSFSLEPLSECLLNVWAVRNDTENYRLVAGIRPQVSGLVGMPRMIHFQAELDKIIASEEDSLAALRELDTGIYNYLTAS